MKKWNIGWGPVSQCNMNCKFCYSKTTRSAVEDLKYEDWKRFIDENHEKIDTINYGTGENTINKDWFKLVKYINDNYPEIEQALTSNGYLSEQVKKDSELYNIVKEALSEIDISLDFCDAEKHNEFRGQKNAYKWALDTLSLCDELKLKPTIVFLGTDATLNRENVDGIFEIAKKYNAKLRMNIYRPTDGINEFTKKFIASYDKVVDMLKYIGEKYKILAISDPLFSSILTDGITEEDPSGTGSLRILSDGSITPSTYLISENFRKFNIKQKNVLDLIEADNYFTKVEKIVPVACKDCEFEMTCRGGVYDRRFLWYNSFEEKDPYCPFRQENYLPETKVKVANDVVFESVHHGYLPTIFFAY